MGMFIHTRTSGSNDTTEDKKRKHSKQAAKSSKYPRTQSHSALHSVQQCLQAIQVIFRRGVDSSHRVRRHYDTARTSRRTATLRPQYKGTNDPRQPVCPAGGCPATQSDSNITSVGVPGCRIPAESTVHV